jgi:hypothetical protein
MRKFPKVTSEMQVNFVNEAPGISAAIKSSLTVKGLLLVGTNIQTSKHSKLQTNRGLRSNLIFTESLADSMTFFDYLFLTCFTLVGLK